MEDACTKTRHFVQKQRKPEEMGLVLSLGAPEDSTIEHFGETWDNMGRLKATPAYGMLLLTPANASINSELHMDQQKTLKVYRKWHPPVAHGATYRKVVVAPHTPEVGSRYVVWGQSDLVSYVLRRFETENEIAIE